MVVRASNGSLSSINFREAAPAAAFAEMFHSNKSLAEFVSHYIDTAYMYRYSSQDYYTWYIQWKLTNLDP